MAARMAWLLSGAGRMPSRWLSGALSRHCPEVKKEFQFSQNNLRPRQEQQRAPGGQYGLEQAARQPGSERHDEKQQCQDQNKPGQPEAVVPGGNFFALHGQTSLCIRALRHPMPGCADCVRAQNVVHCYRQITEELLC